MIAGHVFKAPSCSMNYYSQFLFTCPFLRSSVVAISSLYSPEPPASRNYATANALMGGEKTNGAISGRKLYAQQQLESRVSRGILCCGELWHGQFQEPV